MKILNRMALQGFVRVQLAIHEFASEHPVEIVIANRILAFTGLMLIADQALAAGLGAWATKFKTDTLQPLLEFGMYGAYVAGVGCAGRGVKHFVKYSRGDQSATFNQGAGWTFGGGALMGLGAIANGVGESMSAGGCAPGHFCGE